jgi:hypothetical protein
MQMEIKGTIPQPGVMMDRCEKRRQVSETQIKETYPDNATTRSTNRHHGFLPKPEARQNRSEDCDEHNVGPPEETSAGNHEATGENGGAPGGGGAQGSSQPGQCEAEKNPDIVTFIPRHPVHGVFGRQQDQPEQAVSRTQQIEPESAPPK